MLIFTHTILLICPSLFYKPTDSTFFLFLNEDTVLMPTLMMYNQFLNRILKKRS